MLKMKKTRNNKKKVMMNTWQVRKKLKKSMNPTTMSKQMRTRMVMKDICNKLMRFQFHLKKMEKTK